MKKFLTAIVSALLLAACGSPGPAANNESPVAIAKRKIAAGALVVDVRTDSEFKTGHLPGALNIPVDEVEARIAEFGDKSKPVVVYCRSGNRSGRAKTMLEKAGYTDVTNGGGYTGLKD
jgi:phage shock protein E